MPHDNRSAHLEHERRGWKEVFHELDGTEESVWKVDRFDVVLDGPLDFEAGISLGVLTILEVGGGAGRKIEGLRTAGEARLGFR